MKHMMTALALALSATGLAMGSAALAGPVYTGLQGDVAVGGYDAVSYFTGDGTPAKGSSEFAVRHGNAVYHFANAENAAKFQADPAHYAPQYGGHCAWAMARGYLAPGDPLLYKIVNGKLYLNFNQQVQQTWLGDIPGFIAKADPAWRLIPDGQVFGA